MFRKPIFLVVVVLVALIGYTVYDTNRVIVVHDVVSVRDLPPEFAGYRVLQISDLHGKVFGKNQIRLAEKLQGEQVDVIALTGDYISRQDPSNLKNKTATMDLIAHLKELFPNKPIYFVLGNTDVYDEFSLIEEMKSVGAIPLFGNESHPYRIEKDGAGIWIGSVVYPEKRLRDFSIPDKDFYMALDHYPISIEVEERLAEFQHTYEQAIKTDPSLEKQTFVNYDLLLAGHTHGGQIRIPFLGAIYAPSARPDEGTFPDLFPKYQKGIYQVRDRVLYLSSGLGVVGDTPLLRFRFNDPPEMNIIELQRSK